MFKVKNDNSIHITRGDTGILNLSLKLNGEPYIMGEDDICVLTVKKSVDDAEAIFQKPLQDNKFTIEPADTNGLRYGIYKYDVQLTTGEGVVSTVVTPKDFVVEAEVSW